MNVIESGAEFEVDFPFYLGIHVRHDIEGSWPDETWIPGCKSEFLPPDDTELVANGVGKMILSVVDIHKPGKYPERVFYTRRWIDPEGNEFGSSKLHITTTPTFKRRADSYYHEFRIS